MRKELSELSDPIHNDGIPLLISEGVVGEVDIESWAIVTTAQAYLDRENMVAP